MIDLSVSPGALGDCDANGPSWAVPKTSSDGPGTYDTVEDGQSFAYGAQVRVVRRAAREPHAAVAAACDAAHVVTAAETETGATVGAAASATPRCARCWYHDASVAPRTSRFQRQRERVPPRTVFVQRGLGPGLGRWPVRTARMPVRALPVHAPARAVDAHDHRARRRLGRGAHLRGEPRYVAERCALRGVEASSVNCSALRRTGCARAGAVPTARAERGAACCGGG